MYTLVYPPEDPCGCGSGRQFGNCCLKAGQITLNPKLLNPPIPKSSYSNKKCILSWTSNCCTKISGDHIVSKAVLRVLTKKKIILSSSGFSREHSLDSSSLKTNRLCRRHNSALSPIDTEAARFFNAFVSIHNSLLTNAPSQKLYFFNGIDIERWMLKTLLMTYYAKLTNITPEHFKLPTYTLKLFEYDLSQPLGLYFPTSMTSSFVTENATSVVILTDGDLVSGVTISLGGLSLTLIISGNDEVFRQLAVNYTYRPKSLLFFKEDEVYVIQAAFPNWQGKDIWISQGDQNAKIPTNF